MIGDQFVEDAALVQVRLVVRLERLAAPELADCEEHRDRAVGEVARPHLIRTGPRFDAEAGLQLAAVVEGDHHVRLVVQHPRAAQLGQAVERAVGGEGLGDDLVVVALVHEVEVVEHIQCVGVDRVNAEVVRGHLQQLLVLGVGVFHRRRVDEAGGEASAVDVDEAVAAAVAVFFEGELVGVPLLEVGHAGVELANGVEEVEDGVAAVGQVHFAGEVHGHAEVVAHRGERVVGHGASWDESVRRLSISDCSLSGPLKQGRKAGEAGTALEIGHVRRDSWFGAGVEINGAGIFGEIVNKMTS